MIDKKKYKRNTYPEISIILTMYNQAHCIHKSLRSIQNQSIKNIEIIVIDDCSLDNSTEIIKKYQKNDGRIILLEHERNEGKIKTRTDGIKMAKGKYITIIDGDDSLAHKDVLYNSLNIINLANIDIAEFKILLFKNKTYIEMTNNFKNIIKDIDNKIVYQPELRNKFIIINNKASFRTIQNRNVCGKIVKNEIFQKAIENIGNKYTEEYMNNYEDTLMAVSLFQIANSYYLLKEKGYYYSRDDKLTTNPFIKKIKCKSKLTLYKGLDQILFLKFLIEKTKNNKKGRQIVYHELISINFYKSFYENISHKFSLVYKIFDEMIKSKFLYKKQKKKLLFLKNQLKMKENN